MKSGEVAVEKSVNAFRELKSEKLTHRATMGPSGAPIHYLYQQHPHLQQPQAHQRAAYSPYQQQYQAHALAILNPFAIVQPMPVYHRYGVGAAMANYSSTRPVVVSNQILQLQQRGQHQGGMKRSARPPQHAPPAPSSVPVPSGIVNGAVNRKMKRNSCVRFYNHGTCSYGSTCKYLHDSQVTQMPLSAPARVEEKKQEQRQTASSRDATPSNHQDALHESNFPSLPTDSRTSRLDSEGGNQCGDRLVTPSPTKQLGFRDAVLNRRENSKRADPPKWASPSKSSTNSDSGASESTDEEQGSTVGKRKEPVRGSVAGRPQDYRHSSRIRHQDSVKQHPRHSTRGSYSQVYWQSVPSPGTLTAPLPHPQRSRVVEPKLGHHGYTIQHVYLDEGFRSDDSTAFSVLSRDAIKFVRRIDSELLSIASAQQHALHDLQVLTASLWKDAVINVYGSNYTRLALPASDMDCVVTSSSQADEEPLKVLEALTAALKDQSWTKRVDLLDSAKIPVLKIVYCCPAKSNTEVMMDLTCAHSTGHSGLNARDLIYSYQVAMPALRPLVLILKSHLQSYGLNSAFTGGLSSYGLVLLVIRFLQACGDEHQFAVKVGVVNAEESCESRDFPQGALPNGPSLTPSDSPSPPIYDFSRNGKLTWRTGLGNLLLLFLETYITFDYRRYGVTIENAGDFFPLPPEKVQLEPGSVVSPYIVDPIKTKRSIGNCFRMHEIIQAWYSLYQQVASGVPLEQAIQAPTRRLNMP